MRRLAIVVSTPLERRDFALACELARAGCAAAVDVSIFFMDEAVRELPLHRAVLDALLEDGCDLLACATSATAWKVDAEQVGMLLGSQDDHAALLARADRVVAFT